MHGGKEMETKDKINLGIDAGNLAIAGTELAIGKTNDLFSYLREPTTRAEQALYNALVENKGLKETDIDIAAAQLLVRKWIKKIKNNKNIMDKANRQFEDLLKKSNEHEVKAYRADDDWIDYFMDLTSVVSNEAIQEIFANLLLKEHVEPGTVSKVMLNRMALLDACSARNFFSLCKLTYTLRIGEEDRIIPLVFHDTEMYKMMKITGRREEEFDDYFELCPSEEELEMLSELGFITVAPHSNIFSIYYSEDSDATFSVEGFSKTVKGDYDEEDETFSVFTGYIFYTQVGLALYNALKKERFDGLPMILDAFADIQGKNWYVDTEA